MSRASLALVLVIAACGSNAPAPEEPAPVPTITACEAYQRCCMLYVEKLSGLEGVPQDLVALVRSGCDILEQAEAAPGGQHKCLEGLELLQKGYPPLQELGFHVPEGCAMQDVEIVVPAVEAPPPPDEEPGTEPEDVQRKWDELAAGLHDKAAADPDLLVGGVTVTRPSHCGGALVTPDTKLTTLKYAYKGDFLVREGKTNSETEPVAELDLDGEGTFSVALPAGTYCLIKDTKKDPPAKTSQYHDPTCLEARWKSCEAVVEHPSGKAVIIDLVESCSSPCYFGPPPPSAAPPPPLPPPH
jgi:hypothetical protein